MNFPCDSLTIESNETNYQRIYNKIQPSIANKSIEPDALHKWPSSCMVNGEVVRHCFSRIRQRKGKHKGGTRKQLRGTRLSCYRRRTTDNCCPAWRINDCQPTDTSSCHEYRARVMERPTKELYCCSGEPRELVQKLWSAVQRGITLWKLFEACLGEKSARYFVTYI